MNAEPVLTGVPSGWLYCLTHRQAPLSTVCCVWAECGHRPACDIRRLLIEDDA